MPNYTISFGGHRVTVGYQQADVKAVLEFMFQAVCADSDAALQAHLDLVQRDGQYQLCRDDQTLYRSDNLTDAANHLMGEVIYHLIYHQTEALAIHAGVLSRDGQAYLLPGVSGVGKSSMTLWMAKHGYLYHTDEMVLLDPENLSMQCFPRPFNIKSHGLKAVEPLVDLSQHAASPHILRGHSITMFSPRLFEGQPASPPSPPPLSHILFPAYSKDAPNVARALTPAEAGIELMKTNVIARNLPGHGFNDVLSIIKQVPAYRIEYNHFDQLAGVLAQLPQQE